MNGEPAASVGRDLVGGFNAAMIGLPYTLGRGIVAFALLGPSFAAEGALAGILGAVGVGLLVPLFGGTRVMISGPRVSSARWALAFSFHYSAGRG
ncbi:MAG: hypothetical protein FJW24_07235 [Acidimicrobiia bacterium]|nr:hypothetical protein [Acidimicrobiia bacterium]